MSSQLVARRFVPWRMFVGLALIPLGGLMIYLHLATDILGGGRKIYIMFLALSGAVSAGGVLLITQAFAKACVACKKSLEETAVTVPAEWEGWLVGLAQSGQPAALGALAQAPLPPPGYPATALDIAYCPSCRQVAELGASRQIPDGKGSFTSTKLVAEPRVFAGQEIGWLVDLAKARAPRVPGA